jgi:hypothetical protein
LKTKSAIVSEIYALYPRKVARAAAEKAISKALATTPAETLRLKLYLPMPPPSPFGHPKNCNMFRFRPPGSMVADGRTTAQRGKKSQKMA